ncbi:MAG: tRNA (guanosine(37)-N1)-methyltransferase TrmD [Acidobacteria bacterium]|nr:tRNA (guanosine(37)-N1)-methyltransferase TrmD [Acidobacteriota bacterium]
MIFDIITVFPEMFTGVLEYGILHRARQSGLVDVRIVNLRDFTRDRHRSVDDRPYGGGEGMVLLPAPLFEAIEFCRDKEKNSDSQVALLTPQGKTWSQKYATEFSTISHLILICGRYEGVDQRVIDCLVDREISIGDFILTGGEIPAMVVLDSIVRLLPGALGKWESAVNESFSTGLLDYPQYTRPAEYRGHKVPDVLLSGNHEEIEKWRKQKALEKTKQVRPELFAQKTAQN